MRRLPAPARAWLVAFATCAALAAFSFAHLDVPVARYFWKFGRFLHPLNRPFGAAGILTLESAVLLALVLARLVRGHISRFAETLTIACLASICAYGVNSLVLKPFFGIPNPTAVLHGAHHALHLMKGSPLSSFPSGHMVLAGAFAGVFLRLYPRSLWPLGTLLGLAAALLVAGDWHFLSDVVGGSFLGISAGVLAGEAWSAPSGESVTRM